MDIWQPAEAEEEEADEEEVVAPYVVVLMRPLHTQASLGLWTADPKMVRVFMPT